MFPALTIAIKQYQFSAPLCQISLFRQLPAVADVMSILANLFLSCGTLRFNGASPLELQDGKAGWVRATAAGLLPYFFQ
jgi:hypothetical protein